MKSLHPETQNRRKTSQKQHKTAALRFWVMNESRIRDIDKAIFLLSTNYWIQFWILYQYILGYIQIKLIRNSKNNISRSNEICSVKF